MSSILVVDDSRTQVAHLSWILREAGYQVDMLEHSTAVLQQLRTGSYDLLLSDVVMPEINGYELCRAIKSDPELCHLPVILLTTLRSTSDIMEGLASGADNFIIKPYNQENLLTRVRDALAGTAPDQAADDRGCQFLYRDKDYDVTASRQQIMTFLMSVFEDYTFSRQRAREASQAAAAQLHDKDKRLDRMVEELDLRERHGRALARERDRANAQNLARSRFVATMSHELRTSLNGIIGVAQLLSAGNTDTRQREYLDLLLSLSGNMTKLVTDVLDLSKIEADRLDSENVAFDIRELIAELQATFTHQARTKDLTFTATIGDDVPGRVRGERQHLYQVLLNLCNNAFKFTTAGHITIGCQLVERRAGSVVLHFAVEDTGIGIPTDRLHDIFEPFTQADTSATRQYGGTGLGLTISRRLVRFMGGELAVHSRLHEGSRFSFQLKLTDSDAQEEKRAVRLASGLSPHPTLPTPLAPRVLQAPREIGISPSAVRDQAARLLLVDDNAINRRVGQRLIERLGYECDVVCNGREAVEAFALGRYDLILMDCLMPEMNGYDATVAIRNQEPRHHHTPIIALTAALMEEEQQHCMDVGMDSVLAKPLDISQLRQVLRAYLRRSARSAAG